MKGDITVCIATYNSEKHLGDVLDSVRKQHYPQSKINIVIIDGGSTDSTHSIAQHYNCNVIKNPRVEPIYAKYLGFLQAVTDYLVYLDHDEILENKNSFANKIELMKSFDNLYVALGSGYTIPKNSSIINKYISDYGDPFSYFIYNLSKDSRVFFDDLIEKYPVVKKSSKGAIVRFKQSQELPLVELSSAGALIQVKNVKKDFPETEYDSELIPQLFYLLLTKQECVGITYNDAVIHYSSENFLNYKRKLIWRIKNNIFFKDSIGKAGYSGREKNHTKKQSYKKMLFIPYSLSLVFPLVDSIKLIQKYRDGRYLIHIYLCFLVGCYILYFYMLKILGQNPQLKNYDESKKIEVI